MSADLDRRLACARRWMTDGIRGFFEAEWMNERAIRIDNHGEAPPATLSSAIDSLSQMPEPAFWGMTAFDVVALLVIRDLLPGETELLDIDKAGV